MATKSNAAMAEAPGSAGTLKPQYLEAVSRVERLHRRLLDLIKDEFDRMGWDDINPVQALLMFNIGDAEMTAGELRSRGYYLGSNVSYNLKKLVETGYIFQERSRADRRSVRWHNQCGGNLHHAWIAARQRNRSALGWSDR